MSSVHLHETSDRAYSEHFVLLTDTDTQMHTLKYITVCIALKSRRFI